MAGKTSRKSSPDTAMAFVAAFFSILGFLIAFLTKREDKYVMFYAKQSLVLFIGSLIFSIAGVFPLVGPVISVLGGILVFALWIWLWIYALSGEMKDVPIIGEFAEKLNF